MTNTTTQRVCDGCGEVGPAYTGNDATRGATAIKLAHDSGWVSRWSRTGIRDYCPKCQEREETP
jgi:hypothetical protein